MLCPLSPSSKRLQVLGGHQTAQTGHRKHAAPRNRLPKGKCFLQGIGMTTSHPGLTFTCGLPSVSGHRCLVSSLSGADCTRTGSSRIRGLPRRLLQASSRSALCHAGEWTPPQQAQPASTAVPVTSQVADNQPAAPARALHGWPHAAKEGAVAALHRAEALGRHVLQYAHSRQDYLHRW